jgi:hypothetical protein
MKSQLKEILDNAKLWLKVFLIALAADIICIPMNYIWPENVFLVFLAQTFIPIGVVIYDFNEGSPSFLEFIFNLLAALLITGMGWLTIMICSAI